MGGQDLGYFDPKKIKLNFLGFFLFFFAGYIYSQKAILKL
jgi:hypothetical protein